MKCLYIINECGSSPNNGIGTFINNTFGGMGKVARTCFIDFNANVEGCAVTRNATTP
ncbi:MAG: hypothetical protein LBN29_00400 [Mediterranea sp.]|jgi:hypothetical protein|nr:hypothetical protein [Mediterranea sp.]